MLLATPFAHRGLHSNDRRVPENSMAAFMRAAALGFAIELDVFVLADGRIAVFHDDNLERLCGIRKNIFDASSKEIAELRLLGSDEQIPMLEDVLQAIGGSVPLLIEVKDQPGILQRLHLLWNVLKDYQGAFAVQSFNPFVLGWFAKNAGQVQRGQLSSGFAGERMFFIKKFLLRHMLLNFISRPHFIAYDIEDLPSARVARIRKKGIPVLGWTVRSRARLEAVSSCIDNFIFEQWLPGKDDEMQSGNPLPSGF